ncbi:hypothetical protein FACS189413_02370 [Bacteroidia bacterium]|nr:hypothetical protein FACS189413_02370 [Bacteroidia bacterium]
MKNVNLVSFSLLLLFIVFFIGCDEKEDNLAPIVVANTGALTQNVFADDTQGKSAVTFTTTGAWTSKITDKSTNVGSLRATTLRATVDAPTWLSITPESGDKAGSYTIAITLVSNTTGADRTAVITISCDGTEITITITQKATKEDGTVPVNPTTKLVTRIEQGNWWWAFGYDNQNRLASIESQWMPTLTITYPSNNTVKMSYEDGYPPYLLTLNDNGYIVSQKNENDSIASNIYTYNTAGYLTSMTNYDGLVVYTWENGNLTSFISSFYMNGSLMRETLTFAYNIDLNGDGKQDEFFENKPCGIDIAQFITEVIGGGRNLPLFDLSGKSVKYLPVSKKYYPGDVHYDYSYETDKNGYVTKIFEDETISETIHKVYEITYNQ